MGQVRRGPETLQTVAHAWRRAAAEVVSDLVILRISPQPEYPQRDVGEKRVTTWLHTIT